MNRAWWAMARQPRWIAGLLACLVLAGTFAALGQWQIERAIAEATIVEVDTETPVALESLVKPGDVLSLADGGRRVTVTATWGSERAVVLDRRQGSATGSWLVVNARTNDGACLPVAVGWAPTINSNDFIFIDDSPSQLVGRLVPSDDPTTGDYDNGRLTVVSSADLINRWDCDTMFDAFLVLDEAPSPLQTIASVKPLPQATLNWLNIFYAIEWAFFAVFALYFWYRLVKDAVEREADELAPSQP
jgi:cytochrome oxidase assembly protein ShyY1